MKHKRLQVSQPVKASTQHSSADAERMDRDGVLFYRMHAYPLHISISIRRRKERVKKTGRGEEEKRCAFHLLRIISNPHISIMTRKQDCNAFTPYFSISVVNSSLEAYINVSMHFSRREGTFDWQSFFSSSFSPKSIFFPLR